MALLEVISNIGIPINVKLFFRNNRNYRINTISFDLILTETHNFSNSITSYDIEDGSLLTDHIKNNLESGSLTGLITNFSLNTFGGSSNRAQDAFDELYRIWKARELVTIETIMKRYDNIAISDINVERSSDVGEAIALNISFRQVRIVQLRTVEMDVSVKPKDMESDQDRQISQKGEVGRTKGEIQ